MQHLNSTGGLVSVSSRKNLHRRSKDILVNVAKGASHHREFINITVASIGSWLEMDEPEDSVCPKGRGTSYYGGRSKPINHSVVGPR